jgi:hypothetical protein
MQQAGSSKSVSPLPSSSMQLPQISRVPGSPPSVVVVVEVAADSVVLVVVSTGALVVVLEVAGAPEVVVVAASLVVVAVVEVVVSSVVVVVCWCPGCVVLVVVDSVGAVDEVLLEVVAVVSVTDVVVVSARDVVVVSGGAVVVVAAGHPALKITCLQDAWSSSRLTSGLSKWVAQLTYAPWFRAGQHCSCTRASASGTPSPLHEAACPGRGAASRRRSAVRTAYEERMLMNGPEEQGACPPEDGQLVRGQLQLR